LSEERQVEAALFSAGRPLKVAEIAEATGLSPASVRASLKKLVKEYGASKTALEVAKTGVKYAMQLKQDYARPAYTLAKTDIPRRVVKTLALIAYYQPLKQQRLLEMVGNKAYSHVKELTKLGIVSAQMRGRYKVLSTTNRFVEYFGIESTKKSEIKKWMAKQVGVVMED